jgi:hypothetical protein
MERLTEFIGNGMYPFGLSPRDIPHRRAGKRPRATARGMFTHEKVPNDLKPVRHYLRELSCLRASGCQKIVRLRVCHAVSITSLCSTLMEWGFDALLSPFEPRSFFFQASRWRWA